MRGLKFFKLLFFQSLLFLSKSIFAGTIDDAAFCGASMVKFAHEPTPTQIDEASKRIQKNLASFSKGLVPDWNNENEVNLFLTYRTLMFGDPKALRLSVGLERVKKVFEDYGPKALEKKRFRPFEIITSKRIYPKSKELSKFLERRVKKLREVQANLFHINEESGYWKKVLGYTPPEHLSPQAIKKAPKDQRKELKDAAREHYLIFYRKHVPLETEKNISESTKTFNQRFHPLHDFLKELIESYNKEEKTSEINEIPRSLRQAFVDFFMVSGLESSEVLEGIRNENGLTALRTFDHLLALSQTNAEEFGHSGGIFGLLEKMKISHPTGIEDYHRLREVLEKFLLEVKEQSYQEAESQERRILRSLSAAEAPFRSCLGGTDCSSRTYFEKALEPHYHYVTLTDKKGHSSGHITFVLGSLQATDRSRSPTVVNPFYPVAFIDKIQNVSLEDLPVMINALRYSLKEQGISLVSPHDVGVSNSGISNYYDIRHFMKNEVRYNEKVELGPFYPNFSDDFDFKEGFSRASHSLEVGELMPFSTEDHASIRSLPFEEVVNEMPSFEALMKDVEMLKWGSQEQRMRYIELKNLLVKLEDDPEFKDFLIKEIKDPNQPFTYKKRIAKFFILNHSNKVLWVFDMFKESELMTLLENLLSDSQLNQAWKSVDSEEMSSLFLRIRKNEKIAKKLSDKLFAFPYYDDEISLIRYILNQASYLSEEQRKHLLKFLLENSGEIAVSENLVDFYTLIYKFLKENNIEMSEELEDQIFSFFMKTFMYDLYNKSLTGNFLNFIAQYEDQDVAARLTIRIYLYAKKHFPQKKNSDLIFTFFYERALEIQENPGLSFEKAIENWLKDPKEDLSPHLWTDLISLTVFNYMDLYENLSDENLIPEITESSMKNFFLEDVAKYYRSVTNKDRGKILNFSIAHDMESFRFISFASSPTDEGLEIPLKPFQMREHDSDLTLIEEDYQLQATPVSYLQWFMMMGKESMPTEKEFQTLLGLGLETAGRQKALQDALKKQFGVSIGLSRAMTHISKEDAEEFIRRLNECQSDYTYFIPTEEQWIYALKGTDYPWKLEGLLKHTKNPEELSIRMGFGQQGPKTQPFQASLPTDLGFYQMRGHNWQWVRKSTKDSNGSHSLLPNDSDSTRLEDLPEAINGSSHFLLGDGYPTEQQEQAVNGLGLGRLELDPHVKQRNVTLRLGRQKRKK